MSLLGNVAGATRTTTGLHTTYRPSMVVNFTLHFDETLHVTSVPFATPGAKLPNLSLPDPNDLINAQLGRVTSDSGGDLLVIKRPDKKASFVYGRTPKSGSIELPGYRQAGQFNLMFDFVEMPIDPRTVRSAAVEIHLGAVRSDKFGQGMSTDGVAVLQTTTAGGEANPETLLLFGIVDEWDFEHGDDGSTVTMSGRDLRGLLLDTPIGGTDDPKAAEFVLEQLDLSLPIDACLAQLFSFNPMFADLKPRVNVKEWPGGKIPSPGKAFAVPKHRLGAKGTRKGARANPPGNGAHGGNVSFWDQTVRLCYLVGAIPYFVGKDLLVRPSVNIFQQRAEDGDTLVKPPFAGGKSRTIDAANGKPISGGPLRVRRLVYGRDVQRISFQRKLGGYQRPKTVMAVSVSASGAKDPIQARWPPEDKAKARVHRVAPGGAKSTEEFTRVPVSGITDPDQLLVIARSIYEEIGRGEMGGSCETPNLASFGGDDHDPDLLKLKPGDGVEFLVDTRDIKSSPPLMTSFTQSLRGGFDAQVREVAAKLGDEDLARVIVATARGAVQELQRDFRTSTVRYEWSVDGIKVAFDFQSYVVARADVAPKQPISLADAITAAVSP